MSYRYAGRPGEPPGVLRLHESALRDAGAYIEDEEWDADLRDIVSSYLEYGEFLVGIYNGRLVDMGALRETGRGRAEIKRMRVEPGFQGRGFGQAMLSASKPAPPKRAIRRCIWIPPWGRRPRGACTP